MLKKFLFLSIVSVFSLVFSQNTKADDVFVDLSVLNSLPSSAPATANNQPLFPVVKKSAPQPKPAPKKVEKVVEPEMVTMEVAPVEEVVPAPVEKVEVSPKPEIEHEVVSVEEQTPVEEVKPTDFLTEKEGEVLEAEPIIADAENPEDSIIPTEGATLGDQEREANEEEISEKDNTEENVKEEVEEISPLLPVSEDGSVAAMEDAPTYRVFFDDQTTDLTPDHKAQIDGIISSFEDAKNNKIGIIAYNYDDNGEEAFKKKRQSLNRAIEIRTYLLNKGFKNFSIKVVNISDDAGKKGTVDIEEIK